MKTLLLYRIHVYASIKVLSVITVYKLTLINFAWRGESSAHPDGMFGNFSDE